MQLHNPKEVPCDWQVKKPMESDTDWSFFECQPDAGLLPPGESANMKVVFTPARGREHAYAQRIPIRIAHNPKQVYIQCNGRGLTVQAVLSSTSLDLAAILPAKVRACLCCLIDVPLLDAPPPASSCLDLSI